MILAGHDRNMTQSARPQVREVLATLVSDYLSLSKYQGSRRINLLTTTSSKPASTQAPVLATVASKYIITKLNKRFQHSSCIVQNVEQPSL